MADLIRLAVFANLVLIVTYLYNKIRYKRFVQHGALPQVPPSAIFGHLKILGELTKRGPAKIHPDFMFGEMHKSLGRPPLMFVDFRPVNRAMVVVADHAIAEQVARATPAFPTGLPKSDYGALGYLMGPASILHAHGDAWRALRRRYSPAFAPQHLLTLLPCLLRKTAAFAARLEALARSGAAFPLVPLVVDLTFDVIGAVVMDADLDAQDARRPGELVRLYSELFATYFDDKTDYPWWLIPGTVLRRRRLGRRVDALLRDLVRRKHAEQRQQQRDGGADAAAAPARSILGLSLRDAAAAAADDDDALPPARLAETCDQLKTFLLAGHDTVSTTLAWALYWVYRTPRVLARLRRELDERLGPDTGADPAAAGARLLAEPDLVRRLPYVSAVLKETLRLHPPAATARSVPAGTGFTVRDPASGATYCLDGTLIYNCESLLQRDARVYGPTADVFAPERWLDGGSGGDDGQGRDVDVPPSAWRPFERGPRNCIGQDFALIEMRVIVAVVARRFDFVKVGLGETARGEKGAPVLDEHGIAEVRSQLYNARQVNARPVDDMRMKVRVAAPEHHE
ncbi:cytochrome P450 [Xylariomycetidae sp. FL0641]|nr:cytochrome P450 [Xylariomycetidae sp. FL0641]